MLTISPQKAISETTTNRAALLLDSTQLDMEEWVDPKEGPIRLKLGIEILV